MKKLYVYPAALASSSDPCEITTILGSCVAVVLHDPVKKTGGLCHYLLPSFPTQEPPEGRNPRYGDVAIEKLITELENRGSDRRRLQAKIYGGAEVLGNVTIGKNIGHGNIEIARTLMERHRIPVLEENVGGNRGRRICLLTHTFEVRHSLMQGSSALDPVPSEPQPVHNPATNFIKILVVDDATSSFNILKKVFSRIGFDTVGHAANAFQAGELLARHRPSIVVLALQQPHQNGLNLLKSLGRLGSLPPILVYSLGGNGEAAMRALELGAVDFVHTPSLFDPAQLKQVGEMLVEKIRNLCLERRAA